MENRDLTQLGLTESESKIYVSVLKLGVCTIKDVSKDSGFHRTNIYDIVEQLKEKGLVTALREKNTLKIKIVDPNVLYSLIDEKKQFLDEVFPEILTFYNMKSDQIGVEIYKGPDGMKAAWKDMIREEKPMYGYGIRGQLREKLPVFAKQFLRDVKTKKIPYYGIYTEPNPPSYYTQVRYVSRELSSPVATFIYGDKININIWDPSLIAIVIKSKLVAQTYKQHFDLLWKIGKKKYSDVSKI